MKHIVLFLGWLLIISTPVYAQVQQDTLTNGLKKGARALQFRVQPSFTLGSLDGAVFSGKWHTGDQRAIRIGISVAGRFSNDDNTTTRSTIDNSDGENEFVNIDEVDSESHSFSISLNSYYLFYPNPGSSINLYAGAGPTLLWVTGSSDDLRRSINENISQESVRTRITEGNTNSNQIQAGLGFALGAEWFMNDSMSLIAEYKLTALYTVFSAESNGIETDSDSEFERANEFERSSNRFELRASGALLGLSVYF